MEGQGTGGDHTPLYPQIYDNLQHLNHNVNPLLQQQNQNANVYPQGQQHDIAPSDSEIYNNGTPPFNGESYNNGTAPFNVGSYINSDNYTNGTVPLNGESYNNGTAPFNVESYNYGLRHPLQVQSLPLSSQAPHAFSSSSHNIVHYNNNNRYLYPEIQQQPPPPSIEMQFQPQPPSMEMQFQPQPPSMEMQFQQQQPSSMEIQFQQRQNLEIEIQRIRLLQQQHMEKSKNVNANVVSQSMETVMASLSATPLDGEKRKRDRPRKSCKRADNGVSTPLLGSAPPPSIEMQFQPQPPSMEMQFQLQPPSMEMQFQQQQPSSMEIQFQQRQNLEIEIQRIRLLRQQHMEQSKNVNANMVSQSMETVMASLLATPLDGEKRKRGRPRKLCKRANNGVSTQPLGSATTPQGLQFEYGGPALFQVIVIAPGEDVHEKIMSFYERTPLTVRIISANGTISHVDFQEIVSRRTINHKGEFEILSLSHSYTAVNNRLHVTLAHPDGKIFRGIVGGLLMAASHVEVVVGVFSSSPAYIPRQVGNKGPHIDNVRAFTTEIPISISGQPNTEVYSANDTNKGNL